ncbi:MAG: hypothetical protein NZM10_02720, partial [Fimbriimonadales bacterium]|nr:hypothetical protein [Fimbriimonadales bacterium]
APEAEQALLHQWLARHLSNPHLVIRAAAACVLAELGEPAGVAVLNHLVTSPVVQDRLEALQQIIDLPDNTKHDLVLNGLKSDASLADQEGLWDYRQRSLEILAGCLISRTGWRTLRGAARQWKGESREQFYLLVQRLRDGAELYIAISRKKTPTRALVHDYRSHMRQILKVLESI